MSFAASFLQEVRQVTEQLDVQAIERLVQLLVVTKERHGRLFILGVGVGAASSKPGYASASYEKTTWF